MAWMVAIFARNATIRPIRPFKFGVGSFDSRFVEPKWVSVTTLRSGPPEMKLFTRLTFWSNFVWRASRLVKRAKVPILVEEPRPPFVGGGVALHRQIDALILKARLSA